VIIIVNYGLGNLGSISNMLRKIGAEARVSSDPEMIESADKLVLPGVGAFDSGMHNLDSSGIRMALGHAVLDHKVPVLGICLGMQLLMESSEEGTLPGLGWIKGRAIRFDFVGHRCSPRPVPHMGWNDINILKPSLLLRELEPDARFYFVHSYHVECASEHVMATAHYGYSLPAVIQQDNISGVQFHPEKSHRYGLAVLRAFASGAQTC
jgi:glutamine amidotransferase